MDASTFPCEQKHVFYHSYPPVPEDGDIEGNDDIEPSGSSMFVAETEVDDATVDDGKKRRRAVIEHSEDSTDASLPGTRGLRRLKTRLPLGLLLLLLPRNQRSATSSTTFRKFRLQLLSSAFHL